MLIALSVNTSNVTTCIKLYEIRADNFLMLCSCILHDLNLIILDLKYFHIEFNGNESDNLL